MRTKNGTMNYFLCKDKKIFKYVFLLKNNKVVLSP